MGPIDINPTWHFAHFWQPFEKCKNIIGVYINLFKNSKCDRNRERFADFSDMRNHFD